jgi:hypothetical protein
MDISRSEALTKPTLKAHNMRLNILFVFFLLCFGVVPNGTASSSLSEYNSTPEIPQAETLDVHLIDFTDLISLRARIRSNSSSSQRLKSDRAFYAFEFPGLIFFSCKVAKSYSEVFISKSLRFLFQFTIQANAP